ncbi:hypothetical protein TIFTF001_010710 [Ficus carica]|uniref:Uncharacterized protein n=1 Tax=Ficus carica TaxID=3494 RepID=A0AA88D3L3_FICCA|nr:hypothetical protein TIFTF001_010710 [Ficus carica]
MPTVTYPHLHSTAASTLFPCESQPNLRRQDLCRKSRSPFCARRLTAAEWTRSGDRGRTASSASTEIQIEIAIDGRPTIENTSAVATVASPGSLQEPSRWLGGAVNHPPEMGLRAYSSIDGFGRAR